ncbi:MAG: hypothetical protein QM662_16465 [Gordonia sp. (in: high G+C Gram-positive bacteria)]
MTEIQADSRQLAALGALVVRSADAALALSDVLATSGFHGTRQGALVAESIAEFQAVVRPQTAAALVEFRRHGESTLEISRSVDAGDAGAAARVAARAGTRAHLFESEARYFEDL